MLDRWASFVLRKPKRILLLTLILALFAGAVGSGVTKRVTMGGYTNDNTESAKVSKVLEQKFKQGDPNLALLVTDPQGIDSKAAADAGTRLADRLSKEPGVAGVASYWTSGHLAALRDKAGDKALVVGRLTGSFDDVIKRVKDIDATYSGTFDGLQVKVGGNAMMWNENIAAATKDASRADGTVFPLVLIVLIAIFGSVVAAALPLAVAFATMLFALFLVFGLSIFFEPSNLVENITTFVGIGLAIDYSLLLVTRYREELTRTTDRDLAIRTAVRTAGRTVVFSAITVAVAFSSVLVLPFTIFPSMASASIVTALLAGAGSVTIVPALLKLLGPRIDKWRIIRRKTPVAAAAETGYWHRLAIAVMRRPVAIGAAVLAFVILLGVPALGMKLRLPDEQILPKSAESAQVAQTLRADFSSRELDTIPVVAPAFGDPTAKADQIVTYAERLSLLPHVARVDALTGSYQNGRPSASPIVQSFRFMAPDRTGMYLNVVPAVDGQSAQGRQLVNDIRATSAPSPVLVGGAPATAVDTFDSLKSSLPLAVAILVVGMFVLLFLLTGSVLLPIKAIVLSTLSLTATFGALVFVFQDGHLAKLFGDFIVTGAITWTVPITVFAMAFGLSMDYEVFMLSRIKEEYDRTGDNTKAVAMGLERVGRIITYAAVLISIVFLVWVTSGLSYMKAIGLGLPIAILMDATLIRGILVPAFMRIAGKWNWWAPAPMRRIYERYGLHEAPSLPPTSADPAPQPAGLS